MRYFKPHLALGVSSPAQTRLQDKFGGLPWGLPQERWPLCANCGHPMTFLMQLRHNARRLDLGAPGRVLFVFLCYHFSDSNCDTCDADSGGNAVVILERAELGKGLTSAPDPGAEIEVEARVLEWVAGKDPVSKEQYLLLFDGETHWDVPAEVYDEVDRGTKLGGAPFFPQGASQGHPASHFAGQFSTGHILAGPIPEDYLKGRVPIQSGAPKYVTRAPNGTYHCDAANYAGDGWAYLFVYPDAESPSGKFFCQR